MFPFWEVVLKGLESTEVVESGRQLSALSGLDDCALATVEGPIGELRSVKTLSLDEMVPLLTEDVEPWCDKDSWIVPVPESTGDMEWRLGVDETPIPELEMIGGLSLTDDSLNTEEGLPPEVALCTSTEELVGLSPLSDGGERSGEGTLSSSSGLTVVPSARSMMGIGSWE